MSRSTRIRARTGTRATAKRLPTSSMTWTPSLQPCARDEGVASLLEEKKQERDELKIQLQNYKPLHQRLRLATEDRAKASKVLGGHRGASSPQACGGRSVQGHASAAQQQSRAVGAEKSDGGGQCRATLLRIARGPDVAARLSPTQWAAGFRNCLRSAGRLRRLLQGLSARACSRDTAGSWSFRAVPDAQGSPNGPVPRSAPAGCPQGDSPAFIPAGISALVHNDDWCG